MTAVIPGNKHNQFNLAAAVGAAGGLDVQDVRARLGDREGDRSRHDLLHLGAVHLHDRAVVRRRLRGRQAVDGAHLQPHLRGHDLGHERDPALGQHGLRAAHARRRPRLRLADGEAARRPPDAEAGRLDRARLALGLAARHGRRLRDVRRRRHLRQADRDPQGRSSRTARSTRPPAGASRRRSARSRRASPGRSTRCSARTRSTAPGAGSGDGIHPNAGKTGTTEDHADAWFDGYTRDFSTVVWMGYPRGEIPMLDVHGQAVAGATFPVPIWHLYMAAAEKSRPARQFQTPELLPGLQAVHARLLGLPRRSRRRPTTTTTTTVTTETNATTVANQLDAEAAPAASAASTSARAPVVYRGRRWTTCSTIDEALELVLERVAAARGRGRGARRGRRARARRARGCGRRSAVVPGLGDGRLRAPRGRRARDAAVVARIAAGRPVDAGARGRRGDGDLDRRRRARRRRLRSCRSRTSRSATSVVVVPGQRVETVRTSGRAAATCAPATRSSAAGVRLGPVHLGALAAAGVTRVRCSRAPRVVLAVTGTELRSPGEPLERGEIYDANGVILATQIRSTGATVERLPPVKDDAGVDARGDRARSRGRRARDERRRLGRRPRPRARDRGRARRRGGLLARRGAARKAGRLRRPRPDARLRAARGTRSRRSSASSSSSARRCSRCRGSPSRGRAFRPGPARPRRCSRSPSATRCSAPARASRTATVVLDPLTGQESHMIARAATADALVLVPRGDGELAAGSRRRATSACRRRRRDAVGPPPRADRRPRPTRTSSRNGPARPALARVRDTGA